MTDRTCNAPDFRESRDILFVPGYYALSRPTHESLAAQVILEYAICEMKSDLPFLCTCDVFQFIYFIIFITRVRANRMRIAWTLSIVTLETRIRFLKVWWRNGSSYKMCRMIGLVMGFSAILKIRTKGTAKSVRKKRVAEAVDVSQQVLFSVGSNIFLIRFS